MVATFFGTIAHKITNELRIATWNYISCQEDQKGLTDLEYRLFHGVPARFFYNCRKGHRQRQEAIRDGKVSWRRWSVTRKQSAEHYVDSSR